MDSVEALRDVWAKGIQCKLCKYTYIHIYTTNTYRMQTSTLHQNGVLTVLVLILTCVLLIQLVII